MSETKQGRTVCGTAWNGRAAGAIPARRVAISQPAASRTIRKSRYFRACLLLLLLSLPARFAALRFSLWMDEAWVANSLREPSLQGLFFTRTWTQSTPPLFLVLERQVAALAGPSEAALRLLPLIAAVAGLVLMTFALRRWLSFPAALLGLTFLCCDYWLIKYPQQVKQYGTDFFVSCLLLLLMGRYLGRGRTVKDLAALVAAGAAALPLSYTAVFWLPSIVAAAALPGADGRRFAQTGLRPGAWGWRRAALAAFALGSVLAPLYLVFIRPNRTAALVREFQPNYIDLATPLKSLARLWSTLGLLIGLKGAIGFIAGLVLAVAVAVVAIRAAAGLRAGEPRAAMLILAGVLPWACVLSLGALGLYPVLDYARMLVFGLPGLALLAARGADLVLARAPRPRLQATVVAVCVTAVAAAQAVYFAFPLPAEENRPALSFLKSNLTADDLLFVHPGMYEQYRFYAPILGVRPARLYVGNVQWPCCATGDREQASSPFVKDLAGDLSEAARRARGSRLWLLFPCGQEGHWSSGFKQEIEAAPSTLAAAGCTQALHRLFGQTLVEAYSCPAGAR